MKILGIAFVFSATSFAGFFAGERYLSMLKGIKRAESFIANVILGLQSERQTLTEIFESTANSCDEQTKKFIDMLDLKSLGDASKKASEYGFCSEKTANSILSEAFFVLGKYSAAEQIKELEFCRSKLASLYEKSEENFRSKAKLSGYSGVLAGIFLAIIMF